jgi:protein-S-isoprenylcysteine O-methyltransferase Ste14
MTKFERVFVWLGGAAFAGSLALCAYTFLFLWARVDAGPPRGVGQTALVDATLFTVFAAHHSIFARDSIKTWISRRVPARLIRSVYVWTASLLLVLVVLAWRPIGGDLYHATGWTGYGHALVQLAGVWVIARSVGVIDALELAGIRSSGGPASLQITGPYRFVRHPIYLGWMLIVFGAAHMTRDRATFAAITTIYLIIAMPWEERSLGRTFGNDYARYKQRVRWRVIPFVY